MTEDTEILITLGAVWMLAGVALAHALTIYKIGFIHESGLYIILGLFGGSLWMWLGPTDVTEYSFSSDVFFDVVLPPIIFSAGYNLKRKQFINNFSPIMVLAIFGAILNFLMMSSIAIAIGGFGLEDSECMLFAAIMSATDGVAVVALIDSEAYPTIFGTLIGEGCINDAVAIILYASIDSITSGNSSNTAFAFTANDLMTMFGKVCTIAAASISIGLSVGLTSALYFKHVRMQPSPKTELTILFLFGYLSYSINDSVGMSGIIGVFFCGVCMSHYTYHSLTEASKHASLEAFEAISYAGETFIYISLGFYIFSYSNSGNWSIEFLVVMLGVLVFGRIIIVGVCVLSINICRKGPNRISFKDQLVFWWGGIVRGSICFALSLRKETTHSPVIVTTTFTIVIITTFIISSLTDTFLRSIGMKDDAISTKKAHDHRKTTTAEDRGRLRYYIHFVDEKFVKPIFGGRKRRLYELKEDDPEFEESFYKHYGAAGAPADYHIAHSHSTFKSPYQSMDPSFQKQQNPYGFIRPTEEEEEGDSNDDSEEDRQSITEFNPNSSYAPTSVIGDKNEIESLGVKSKFGGSTQNPNGSNHSSNGSNKSLEEPSAHLNANNNDHQGYGATGDQD